MRVRFALSGPRRARWVSPLAAAAACRGPRGRARAGEQRVLADDGDAGQGERPPRTSGRVSGSPRASTPRGGHDGVKL